MRLFGIEPQTVTFSWGKMQVVVLGEEGRGRKLTYVPFQADFEGHYGTKQSNKERREIR